MSDFYDQMQGVAESMLTDFGTSIKIEDIQEDVDKVEGCVSPIVTNSFDFNGAGFAVTKGEHKQYFEGLTNIEARKLLLAAKGATFEPGNGNVVTFEGVLWTIQHVNILRPDGATALTFEVFVKRGGVTSTL